MQLEKVSPFGSGCGVKQNPKQSHSASAHQTVTEAIKLNTGTKTIAITIDPAEFTPEPEWDAARYGAAEG